MARERTKTRFGSSNCGRRLNFCAIAKKKVAPRLVLLYHPTSYNLVVDLFPSTLSIFAAGRNARAFLALVLLQVSGDTDNRLSLCGNACIRVARGDGTLTPAQIDARISLASSNHKQCSVRCTALYQQGDTLDSLVDKLAQIPFEELFRDQK